MSGRVLPLRPNLAQYKKQAKELLRSHVRGDSEALGRIRWNHPRLEQFSEGRIRGARFNLADAQLVIAREHGFETWARFAKHVEAQASLGESVQRVSVGGLRFGVESSGREYAKALVLMSHASGTARFHPTNCQIAQELNRRSVCTLSVDLLTEDEEIADMAAESYRFDIRQLARRIGAVMDWIAEQPYFDGLPLGLWGSDTSAAAALCVAGEYKRVVRAVVSSSGRPDLAGPWLWKVEAPTLLIAGGSDSVSLGFNRSAMEPFSRETICKLEVVAGANQRFDTAHALEVVTTLTGEWFDHYLK